MTLPSSIRMGEFSVAKGEGVLRTLVGSCIGLALYDAAHKVAGLAHIVLPKSRNSTDPSGKFVDTAIPALLRDMMRLTGGPINPTARLTGGANMFATKAVLTIGYQNIEASERILGEMGIPIVGSQCGGEKGRRVTLDAATGLITIEIAGADPMELHDRPCHRRTP
ncbi:MAG: chemotaxis protein CheD [Pseudoalteromonas tetraodonis]|jgi:chemotaxis protein CheD